jgi:RNA polymerase sigma factor for flagellar operon FliA
MKKATKTVSKKITVTKKLSREQLILEHAPLIKYIAHRIALRVPPHIEVQDLIDAGVVGLIDAIEKYDPSKDVKFKTYAEFRIRGAIFDELRSLDWVPRSVRKMINKLEETYLTLEQRMGRPATDEEVAEEMGLQIEDFYQLLRQASGVSLTSIDQSLNIDNSSKTVLEVLEDSPDKNPMGQYSINEMKELVTKAINNLPEKERLVISLYYYEELTMKEIGKVLNLTESRVSQIHTKAILRLRGRLKTVKGKEVVYSL